jgi:hypothetical protein
MNKILLVGFVCVSLGAFAQSGADQSQASSGKASTAQASDAKTAAVPKDAATGQASGKRIHQPLAIHRDLAARDVTTGNANGKKSAQDDWSAGTAAKSKSSKGQSSSGQASTRVAAGDVNGDGKAELKATKSSGHATEKNAVLKGGSSIQGPRDAASGQASGK